ncbi:MAG: hypothetical protein ABXS92_08885, partial [Sulfurimonas sp.]
MRGIIVLCVVFWGLLSPISAAEDNIEINEYRSDIYYGNGIMVSQNEADRALWFTLVPAIKYEIYNGNEKEMNNYHQFSVAYNYSAKELFGDTAIAMALDMMEAYDQLSSTSWGWATANALLDWITPDRLAFFGDKPASVIARNLERFGIDKFIASHLADAIVDSGFEVLVDIERAMDGFDVDEQHDLNLETMVNSYKKSIRSGHAVIMVTHSQGNLFAVEAADEIVGSTELGGDAWMKKFLYHVSVASPATRFARSNYHYLISFDNDAVANIPGSVGPNMPNYARYFTHEAASVFPSTGTPTQLGWIKMPPVDLSSPIGYWMRGSNPQSYTAHQSYYDPALNLSQEYTFEVVPDEWEYAQTNFHAFDFYMGKTVYKLYRSATRTWTPPKNAQTKEFRSSSHRLIIDSITHAIDKHRTEPSQWFPKNLGCLCKDKYAEMTHMYDAENIKFPEPNKIKDFAEDKEGKIYQAVFESTGKSEYVRASHGGEVVKEVEEGEACYELVDSESKRLGTVTGHKAEEIPD